MKYLTLLCVILGQYALGNNRSELVIQMDDLIQQSGIAKSDLGLIVTDSNGKNLFTLNENKRLMPASITKIMTSLALLNFFESDYQFHTQLYISGDQSDQILEGDIYLKGGGDPGFVSEKMWMLVNDFTRTGIKKISGKIIVDDSFFDDERVDLGRESDNVDRAYDAPIGALSFNWNSANIFVRPGDAVGEKARAWVDPENKYAVLKNNGVTSKNATDLVVSRVNTGSKDIMMISGKIAINAKESTIYRNITNPALFAGAALREFLKQRNIEVEGEVVEGIIPPKAKLIVDQLGEPLGRILTGMNKFSNNYIAEMLTKDLGAVKTKGVGHMKDGLEQIREFMELKLKIDKTAYTLVNVSGLTRKNSFTSQHFADALNWVRKQFKIYPEFVQSLPISGIDGTLHKRLKGEHKERWVRAKTGSLTGVVSLAGYVGRHDSDSLTFVFIYNGNGKEGRVRELFDKMTASLVK